MEPQKYKLIKQWPHLPWLHLDHLSGADDIVATLQEYWALVRGSEALNYFDTYGMEETSDNAMRAITFLIKRIENLKTRLNHWGYTQKHKRRLSLKIGKVTACKEWFENWLEDNKPKPTTEKPKVQQDFAGIRFPSSPASLLEELKRNMREPVCFVGQGIEIESYKTGEWRPKPPLGLIPKSIHNTSRLQDIHEAINRYLEAKKDVPAEWLIEKKELEGN